jgi:hypothetical protein
MQPTTNNRQPTKHQINHRYNQKRLWIDDQCNQPQTIDNQQ